jgi:hypothetical protein
MMKTIPIARNKSAASDSSSMRIVVYSDGSTDEPVLRFLSHIPAVPGLDVHVVDGSERQKSQDLMVRVLRPAHALPGGPSRLTDAESVFAQALLAKCGPGRVHERLARYCAKVSANLIVVTMPRTNCIAPWWIPSRAERLASHTPVLAIPHENSSVLSEMAQRRLRWLVPLDGSTSAEKILYPLRCLAGWLPSDFTFIQPLAFAGLWRDRVARNQLGPVSKLGPSISDSSDYLARVAEWGFANSPTRVCCTIDSDAVRSIVRLANSPAIDAIAIGLSKRSRITRLLALELNDLLLRKVHKPILLLAR